MQVRQRAASEAAPHLSGPIRVQETPGSQTVKRALEFRSWQAASDLVRGWEADVQIGGGNQSSRRSHRRSITSSPTCRPRTSVPNRSASTTTCSSRGCAPGVRRGDSATCRSSASSRPASSAARGAAALATRSRTCDATDSSGHSRWHHRSQWIAKDVRSSPQAAHRGASHWHAVRPIASVFGFRLRFHTKRTVCRWSVGGAGLEKEPRDTRPLHDSLSCPRVKPFIVSPNCALTLAYPGQTPSLTGAHPGPTRPAGARIACRRSRARALHVASDGRRSFPVAFQKELCQPLLETKRTHPCAARRTSSRGLSL